MIEPSSSDNQDILDKPVRQEYSKAEAERASDSQNPDSVFECNICLDTCANAVVTYCGHLFCWECLSPWMSAGLPGSTGCPVCKSGIDNTRIIPIYSRGRENLDPRLETPRPDPQRTTATPQQTLRQSWLFFTPFAIFNINQGTFNHAHWNPDTDMQRNIAGRNMNGFISRMFLMLATLVLVSITLF